MLLYGKYVHLASYFPNLSSLYVHQVAVGAVLGCVVAVVDQLVGTLARST